MEVIDHGAVTEHADIEPARVSKVVEATPRMALPAGVFDVTWGFGELQSLRALEIVNRVTTLGAVEAGLVPAECIRVRIKMKEIQRLICKV